MKGEGGAPLVDSRSPRTETVQSLYAEEIRVGEEPGWTLQGGSVLEEGPWV